MSGKLPVDLGIDTGQEEWRRLGALSTGYWSLLPGLRPAE
jgi:hypothetical protein